MNNVIPYGLRHRHKCYYVHRNTNIFSHWSLRVGNSDLLLHRLHSYEYRHLVWIVVILCVCIIQLLVLGCNRISIIIIIILSYTVSSVEGGEIISTTSAQASPAMATALEPTCRARPPAWQVLEPRRVLLTSITTILLTVWLLLQTAHPAPRTKTCCSSPLTDMDGYSLGDHCRWFG